ncbi:MAG TPA: DUF6531 domain-containing protein [Candidatus Acidoferrales bacterium]|nr:DUF6531 domain-containing protein [Candidatus Acidoferrales bacterium]
MKNIVVVIGALLVFLCALSVRTQAQVNPACTQEVGNGCIWGYNSAGPCPGWFNCLVEGPWLVTCSEMTYACPPPDAAPEIRNHCPQCGQPVSLLTGDVDIKQTDFRIPGLGGGLSLTRTWNSMWPSTQASSQVGIFGPNWRSGFEERIFVGSDNYIKYARGDGSFWSFGAGGPGWEVAAPANESATLVSGNLFWTLTFQNGEQRLFDNTSGDLIAIIDRNGNETQLTYDAVGRLVTVTDPASRHLYFHYANDSSYLVTSVTSDVGITTSYAYDSQERLSQVTEPDGSTLSFQYDANSLISAVLDSDGKVLEAHTYDGSGRGLTSSRANGVEAVTLAYGAP